MIKTRLQTLTNKKGEVTFRQKLVKQHSGHVITSPHEPNFEENLVEIKNRLKKSQQIFSSFQKRKIKLSPFVEIAAGQGYRSEYLINKCNAVGFATDISQHSLASSKILAHKFTFKKQSVKICCDANNLPFVSNSFPFAFITLSLHHFPDPGPIISEIARILSPDGSFYFDDEPIKQGLNLNLWRRDYHLRWYEKILKYFVVLIWLSRIGKAEVDEGILEETFSLEMWEKAFVPFKEVEIYQTVFPFPWKTTVYKSNSSGWIYPNTLVRLGLWLFGGGIGGLAKIKKSGRMINQKNIWNFLGCPNCRKEYVVYPLKKKNKTLICVKCKTTYVKKDNVWMLLPKKLLNQLYGKKN